MTANSTQFYRCGLIGWPVAHSLSPRIHQAAFEASGLRGEYKLYAVDPADPNPELDTLLNQMRSGEIHGLNVTVPHKELLLSRVDQLSATARAIGAVNTLALQSERIFGDNSDAPGFLNQLSRLALLPSGKSLRAVILGAGGSARAVAYALGKAGHTVYVSARRSEQAQSLVGDLNRNAEIQMPLAFLGLDFDRITNQVKPDLLINTTPSGMHPNSEQSPWPLEIPLPEGCFVYDLIYNPAQTLLLRYAQQSGLFTANGLGMLVEQAAISFAIWTGIQPPLKALYMAVGLNQPAQN